MTPSSINRADIVAAWVTGIGIGVGVFMIGWIVANRLTGLFMSAPEGPVAAMATAVVAGTVTATWHGRRLAARFRPD